MEEKRIEKRWSDSRCALGGGCTVAIAEAGYTLALLASARSARALNRNARLGVLIDQHDSTNLHNTVPRPKPCCLCIKDYQSTDWRWYHYRLVFYPDIGYDNGIFVCGHHFIYCC